MLPPLAQPQWLEKRSQDSNSDILTTEHTSECGAWQPAPFTPGPVSAPGLHVSECGAQQPAPFTPEAIPAPGLHVYHCLAHLTHLPVYTATSKSCPILTDLSTFHCDPFLSSWPRPTILLVPSGLKPPDYIGQSPPAQLFHPSQRLLGCCCL